MNIKIVWMNKICPCFHKESSLWQWYKKLSLTKVMNVINETCSDTMTKENSLRPVIFPPIIPSHCSDIITLSGILLRQSKWNKTYFLMKAYWQCVEQFKIAVMSSLVFTKHCKWFYYDKVSIFQLEKAGNIKIPIESSIIILST